MIKNKIKPIDLTGWNFLNSMHVYLCKYTHYSIVTIVENYTQNDMPSCTC